MLSMHSSTITNNFKKAFILTRSLIKRVFSATAAKCWAPKTSWSSTHFRAKKCKKMGIRNSLKWWTEFWAISSRPTTSNKRRPNSPTFSTFAQVANKQCILSLNNLKKTTMTTCKLTHNKSSHLDLPTKRKRRSNNTDRVESCIWRTSWTLPKERGHRRTTSKCRGMRRKDNASSAIDRSRLKRKRITVKPSFSPLSVGIRSILTVLKKLLSGWGLTTNQLSVPRVRKSSKTGKQTSIWPKKSWNKSTTNRRCILWRSMKTLWAASAETSLNWFLVKSWRAPKMTEVSWFLLKQPNIWLKIGLDATLAKWTSAQSAMLNLTTLVKLAIKTSQLLADSVEKNSSNHRPQCCPLSKTCAERKTVSTWCSNRATKCWLVDTTAVGPKEKQSACLAWRRTVPRRMLIQSNAKRPWTSSARFATAPP